MHEPEENRGSYGFHQPCQLRPNMHAFKWEKIMFLKARSFHKNVLKPRRHHSEDTDSYESLCPACKKMCPTHACYKLRLPRRNSTWFAKHWESGKNFGVWSTSGNEERLDEGVGRTRKSFGKKAEDRWVDEDVSSPQHHAWSTMHEWWALHAWDPSKHCWCSCPGSDKKSTCRRSAFKASSKLWT